MKKMLKVVLAITLVAVMAVSFAACGKKETLKSPKEMGKLIIATNAEFPPFEFVATNSSGICGEFDGIDIAIANEIAKEMGVSLEVTNMEFTSIIPAVDAGKVHMGIAGMTVTDERRQNVDFSDVYWTAIQTIIVKEGNTDITSVETLKGKKVGVVTGYTGDLTLSEIEGIDPARYQKGVDAVQDLINGKIDAVVIDSPTAEVFIAKNPGLKGVEDPEVFAEEHFAIAVKKGNAELLAEINTIIKKLKDAGEFDRIAAEVGNRLAQ